MSTISTNPAECSQRTTDDVTVFQQVVHVFQATVEGLTTSYKHQINALQQQLQSSNNDHELKKTEKQLCCTLTAHP
jgi:hypothetical protein